METRTDEIADGVYRLSIFVPEVAPPAGFTFNQFLLVADEPLLFHCGFRRTFPAVSEAVARLVPLDRLRWIGFGHVEADECGAMNEWLAVAPRARVAHGETACAVSLDDLADRAPRMLANGEVIDLGGKRVRYVDTAHVPHGWESGIMFEEETGTLLCGDLFTQTGNGAAVTDRDIIGPAIEAEEAFGFSSLSPTTGRTIRSLAELAPRTLAVMHGSSFGGRAAEALVALGDYYDQRIRAALAI